MCFLAAFWLSAVLLYGDEWSITSSASNFARLLRLRNLRRTKAKSNKEQRMRFSHSLFFVYANIPINALIQTGTRNKTAETLIVPKGKNCQRKAER